MLNNGLFGTAFLIGEPVQITDTIGDVLYYRFSGIRG